jgi:hemerythrin
MLPLSFPTLVTHREQHRAFAVEVGKLKEGLRIEGATPGLIATATQFITGWLNQHITTMDRAIGEFAKTHPNPGF